MTLFFIYLRYNLPYNKMQHKFQRKESSGGIVLQENPNLAMQYWRGPRAFSNRYVPWERDPSHPQVSFKQTFIY